MQEKGERWKRQKKETNLQRSACADRFPTTNNVSNKF
jgi:hypothetical protein